MSKKRIPPKSIPKNNPGSSKGIVQNSVPKMKNPPPPPPKKSNTK